MDTITSSQTKEWLRWILDFIRTDLGFLKQSRKEELLDRLVYFTWDTFPALFPVFGNDDENRESYFPLSKRRSRAMKKRFRLVEAASTRIQKGLRSILEAFEDRPLPAQGTTRASYKLGATLSKLVLVDFFTSIEPWFDVKVIPKAQDDVVTLAKLHLAQLLRGLPLHSVTKCRGCKHYFVNLTERNKIYCNSSCASRSIARMKRGEIRKDPMSYEAYKEKQRQYMRERYAKMKRAKQLARKSEPEP